MILFIVSITFPTYSLQSSWVVASTMTLGTLASEVKIYPQLLENLRVTDKKAVLEHPAVKEVIEQVKEDLGSDGRILVPELL